jgi:hypothetical protein
MTDRTGTQLSLFDARDAAAAFTVRHSQRARRLTVRVFVTGRVEVVVPPRTAELTVRDFVARHGSRGDAIAHGATGRSQPHFRPRSSNCPPTPSGGPCP